MRSSGSVCVISGSMSILPSMYQSTIFGTSVRPRAPPKAVPFQTRPVTSWNGRVRISWPAPATPMMTRHAPAAVAALERLAHQVHVADALEAVVGAAVGERDEVRHEVAADFLRVHEVRHAELLGERLARRVDVDADDLVGAGHARALDHVEPDAAEAEHDDVGAGLDLRRVDDGADARGDAAADVADLVERRVGRGSSRARSPAAPCGSRTSSSPCSGGSACRPSEKRLVPSGIRPLPCVARIAVHRLVLRDEAGFALPALRRVERDDVVALRDRRHARARRRRRCPRPRARRSPGTAPRDRRRSA